MTSTGRSPQGSPHALPIAAGGAAALLGATVIAGWLLHVPEIVQIDPAYPPMQFNSALSFVLLGAATIAASMHRRGPAAVLALAAGTLPMLTLLQYVSGNALGVDTLFLEPFVSTRSAAPGRMAAATALCFVSCVLALLIQTPVARSPARAIAGAVLAAVTLGIAGSTLTGYLLGLDAASGGTGLTRMAMHTSIAMLLLSMAIASMPLLQTHDERDLTVWLNGTIGVALFVVVLTFWQVLGANQRQELQRSLQSRGDYVAQTILDGLRHQQQTLRRAAERWELQGMSEADWRLDVRQSVREDSVLHAIAWIDGAGALRWVETHPDVDLADDAIAAAVRTARIGRIGVVQPEPGRTLLLAAAPLEQQARSDGMLVGIVAFDPLLRQLFDALAERGVAVTVRDGDRVLADDGLQGTEPVHRRTVQVEDGDAWTIEISPGAHAVPALSTAIADLLLLVSLLLCAALLFAFHAARRASLRGAALEIERTRLADVIAATSAGTWEWDLQTGAIAVNERWAQMIGRPYAAVVDREQWRELAHPDDIARVEQVTMEHIEGRTPGFEVDYRMRHLDGRWIWIQARGRVVRRAPDGRPLAASGTNTDISARRAIEESLRLSQRRFSQAFETAAQGMALVGLDDAWLEVNASLCRLLGYSRDALMQTVPGALVHPDDLAEYRRLTADVLAGARDDYLVEQRYLHRDGHPVWVLLSVSLVRDDASAPLHFIFQLLDIGTRKRIDDMKSQFVSTVSHELRTPLTSISGALGLVLGGALGEMPEAVRGMLTVARQNSDRLNQLINDLLDLEKLEAGLLPIQLTRATLRTEAEMAVSVNQGYADRLGVRFRVAASDDGDAEVDRLRLQQVLANLLSNAAKFSVAAGTVTVKARRRGDRMRISVHNDGDGIAPEFRSRIFQKFSQGDSADTRQRGGTGLGLAISKELVERMGGTIGFESEQGRGATFWVEFARVSHA